MLILTIDPDGKYVQIGDDIRIYNMQGYPNGEGRQIKVGIDAPKNIRIIRSDAVKRDPPRDRDARGNR